MRAFAFLAVLLAASPAFAEECGDPPAMPELPAMAARASEDLATQVVQGDHDFAQDVEGYLVCLQLAESDIHAAVARGEVRPVEERVMVEKFQEQAAEARGRQTRWAELFDRWSRAWTRAHHKALPSLPD
jgi:hypothetical protein